MATQHEEALAERFLNKRVKRSWRSLRVLWDRVCNCGTASRKAAYKAQYEEQAAQRGTVVEILKEDASRGVAAGLNVKWDHGDESKCLPYMVDLADDEKEN